MRQLLQPSERLIACEQVIERGIAVFVEVGKALTEIRDGRLYRATHKTFEAYCKERWEIGRSRAYELIGQAEVASALGDAAGDLSAAADISKRDARHLQRDLPRAVEQVRQQVHAGVEPKAATAAAVEAARRAAAAEESDHQRQRDEARAALPQAVRDAQARRAAPMTTDVEALKAENAELREANEAQEREIASLRASLAGLEGMRTQYEQGGFAKVIADKDEEIRVLETRVAAESRDKASWKKSADFWKEQANRLGYSDDVVIDMETGVVLANG